MYICIYRLVDITNSIHIMLIYVICIANPIPQDTIANAYAIWCVAIYHCDILNYNTVGHMQTNK